MERILACTHVTPLDGVEQLLADLHGRLCRAQGNREQGSSAGMDVETHHGDGDINGGESFTIRIQFEYARHICLLDLPGGTRGGCKSSVLVSGDRSPNFIVQNNKSISWRPLKNTRNSPGLTPTSHKFL